MPSCAAVDCRDNDGGDHAAAGIGRVATAAQRRTSLERAAAGSRLLLDAAFLVAVAKSGAFRSAARERMRDLRTLGVTMSLTGPWPPYNFVE